MDLSISIDRTGNQDGVGREGNLQMLQNTGLPKLMSSECALNYTPTERDSRELALFWPYPLLHFKV